MKSFIISAFLFLSIIPACVNAQGLDIPDPPDFQAAAVMPGSSPAQVEISWLPSDSADVEGYIIYRVISGITQQFDTVYGRFASSYTHFNSGAETESQTYRLAAFDTLDNLSALTDPHTTIFARLDYEICDLDVNLNWSDYVGFENIDHYNIFRSRNGGPYTMIGSVNGSSNTYTDNTPGAFNQNIYYIEAVDISGVAAASNEISIYTNSYTSPAFLNADYASVEDGNINLSFTVDSAGEIDVYRILRSEDSVYYSTIKTVANTGQLFITHVDQQVEPSENKYYYKLQAFDPCGNVKKESNLASNMILKVTGDQILLSHDLKWSQYEDWKGEIQDYEVYAEFGNDAPFIVSTLSGDAEMTSNNISGYVQKKHSKKEIVPDTYCYFIQAREDASTNPHGFQGVAKSNKACISHKPRFFSPTAFYPNSYQQKNREFRPIISFASDKGYKFAVYDRWGMEIFSTSDPTEAWNGDMESRRAKPGKYVYFVTYTDATGQIYEESGYFILYNR